MFCNKCGNQVESGTTFCNKCGNTMGAAKPGPPASVAAPTNPYQATQPAGAAVLTPTRTRHRVIIIVAVVLVLIVGVMLGVRAIQEKSRADNEAKIDAEFAIIDGVIQSYAAAMSAMNFEYAATFCVPGGNTADNMTGALGLIPGLDGDAVKDVLPLLGKLGQFKYTVLTSQEKSTISEEKASISAHTSMSVPAMPELSAEADGKFTMRKIDGTWYIEFIG